MSIQVAILKVLASHGSGRATLASLKRDIAILSTSGPDWTARLKRLAARVPVIDIFGSGHVVRDEEGWQIMPSGRDFLRALEAVSQDNLPAEIELAALRTAQSDGAMKLRSSSSVTGSRTGRAAIAIRPCRNPTAADTRVTIRARERRRGVQG